MQSLNYYGGKFEKYLGFFLRKFRKCEVFIDESDLPYLQAKSSTLSGDWRLVGLHILWYRLRLPDKIGKFPWPGGRAFPDGGCGPHAPLSPLVPPLSVTKEKDPLLG